MSESVILALIAFAGLAIGAIATFLGIAATISVQTILARTAAKTAHTAGVLAADAAAYSRVTNAQTMTQEQVNRQDVTIRDLQKELAGVKTALALANAKLDESEKLRTPLHEEIAGLKKKVEGLEETVRLLNDTINKMAQAATEPKPGA